MQFGWANKIKTFASLLILIGMLSCNVPDTAEINRTFQPQYNGKIVKTHGYGQDRGFCSSTFFINSDSTFTFEGGCEGNSRSTTGHWHLSKDSIRFISLKRSPKNLSFNVTLSQASNDKYVIFIILDKTHRPIPNFAIQPFNEKTNYNYVAGAGLTISSGRGFDNYNLLKTDSLGVLKIRKNKSDSLDFTKLYPLTGKTFRIRNRDLPDTIKLIININEIPFRYDHMSYDNEMANHQIRFKYINGKMIF
jgi:hypothetical protein